MYRITTEFEDAPMEITVGDAKTSGRIYVPKEMIGHTVVVALIPDDATKIAPGMPTKELIGALTFALGMSVNEWDAVVEKGKCIGELRSSEYPNEVTYNEAANELVAHVKSMRVGAMTPQEAFCHGAFVGMHYQPHMIKEFDRKAEEILQP